jgi:Domain of unknown function (DUF5134)
VGGPGWLSGMFAALMLTVATYCTGRLLAARWWHRPTELDTDGAHIVMGIAMAGMLVPGLPTLPARAWEGVFAAGVLWFGGLMLRARRGQTPAPWRCLHAAPHLVECAAMLYMFLLLPPSAAGRSLSAGMGGMSGSATGSRFSFLALLMALFLLGYVVWLGDRRTVRTPALALAGQRPGTSEPLGSGPPMSGAASTGWPDAGPAPGQRYLAPRCAVLCKIAMAITMGYMLILML